MRGCIELVDPDHLIPEGHGWQAKHGTGKTFIAASPQAIEQTEFFDALCSPSYSEHSPAGNTVKSSLSGPCHGVLAYASNRISRGSQGQEIFTFSLVRTLAGCCGCGGKL